MTEENTSKLQDDVEYRVSAHRYCALMGEAIYSVVRAHNLKEEAVEMELAGNNTSEPAHILRDAGLFARYAFLLASNALENCAHSVLANSERLSGSLVEELDKLSTLNKFEVFALIHGKTVDRANIRYARAKEVIKCRNKFVHPKALMVPIERHGDKAIPRSVGDREYPLAFEFIEIDHVVSMIGDILNFVAWVVYDLCKFSPSDGADLINDGSQWWTADFYTAEQNWKYDLRSLGDFRGIKVRTVQISEGKGAKSKKSRRPAAGTRC